MDLPLVERPVDGAPAGAFHRAMLGVSLLVPALMAASHAMNVTDAAHDEAVVRAIGHGWTGGFRALDVALAALFAWLPLGTRAFRAGLASAAVCGISGGVMFGLARALLASCATAPRLGPAVAAIASTTATLSVGFQLEAGSPGGSILGAALALAPLAILAPVKSVQSTPFAVVGFFVGLALTYEPLLGLMAAGSALCFAAPRIVAAVTRRPARRDALRFAGRLAIGVALGFLPFFLALVRGRRGDGLALVTSAFAAPLGERGASTPISLLAFVHVELGYIEAALAVGGLVVAAFVARARPVAGGLWFIMMIGVAAILLGAPAGPTRYAPPVLAAIAATTMLAGVAMQALVRAVANAQLPFARASASMIVLLEAAVPVHAADEAMTRTDERARGTAAIWDEVAWGPLPPAAVLLLNDPRLLPRLLASRASGELRGDLVVVPTFDLGGSLASRELVREPKLGPFWRDMALSNVPDEFSLSSLAATRPVVTSFTPRWERPLSRHLVPIGLVARFETEPRGPSDRKRALDGMASDRLRLEKAILKPWDPELALATAYLLRARAIGFVATGERDLVARGLDDLRPFSPIDPVASEIVRRIVMAKGIVDVKDLTP